MSIPPTTPYRPPPLLAVRGLTTAFSVFSGVEILMQLVLLGLIVFGLVSPDLISTSATLLGVFLPAYAIVSLTGRALGTVAMVRNYTNLRRLGMQDMRIAPLAVAIFWIPLFLRPLWLMPYILFPDQPGIHAVWAIVVVGAVACAIPLHELWRASAPDQIEHWRYVPLGGPVVGWTVAAVVDAFIPLVQPFAIWASVVVVRGLSRRLRDKQVVVNEVGLLAARAAATETSVTAESTP